MEFEHIATIILAAGTAYNYIVTARVRAKQTVNNEIVASLKTALKTEREVTENLRKEVERLRSINDEQLEIIISLKNEIKTLKLINDN